MPSPVGHALGGVAAGWLIAGAPGNPWPWRRRRGVHATGGPGVTPTPAAPFLASWRGAILFALLGTLPDVDLLFHAHSMYTHSVGAALIVLLAATALARTQRLLTGLACGAAYASHTLLDWLGHDTTAPFGIMALWPFSPDYYDSGRQWFMPITRRYWLPEFWTHNLLAMLQELVLIVPVVVLIYLLRRRTPR